MIEYLFIGILTIAVMTYLYRKLTAKKRDDTSSGGYSGPDTSLIEGCKKKLRSMFDGDC